MVGLKKKSSLVAEYLVSQLNNARERSLKSFH